MSESKSQDMEGDDEEYLNSLPTVEIEAVEMSPNPAALTDELNLEVDFRLDKTVMNGVWDIQVLRKCDHIIDYVTHELNEKYLVDSVNQRHIIKLGEVEAQTYAKGSNHFQFSVSHIDIAGIKPSQLTNCGLLIASFKNDQGDIMDLKMVVQVTENRDGLQRIIYNPLE